jgi:methionyl-tRNA formyltransferase
MNPEPMAWTTISDSPIRILAVRETQASDTPIATGSVVLQDGNVVVGCENSNLLLLQVQPAGKLAMSATDWLRGQKNKDDIVLGT